MNVFSDQTMIVGLHGVLEMHSWLEDWFTPNSSGVQDMYSLTLTRSEALGLGTIGSGPPTDEDLRPVRWSHSDAGGDWNQDSAVRELGWLQTYAERLPAQRVPVLPAAVVLHDSISRVGQYTFTGIHSLVPLHMGMRKMTDLVAVGGWFALENPNSSCEVAISIRPHIPGAGARAFLTELEARSYDLIRIESTGIEAWNSCGLSETLAGDADHFVSTDSPTMYFSGVARYWSLDFASWLIELVADAGRSAGLNCPALISVARADLATERTTVGGDADF